MNAQCSSLSMNILMLDLEGVLIWSALYSAQLKPWREERLEFLRRECGWPDDFFPSHNNIRPYAREFLSGCNELFDRVWMNTRVDETRTAAIMTGWFAFPNYRYWPPRGGCKTVGYGQFAGDTLVHVEDGVSLVEREEISRLGMHFVPVSSYHPLRIPESPSLEEALYSIRSIIDSAASSREGRS